MIEIWQGETADINIDVEDSDGSSIDLSGFTAIFAYRKRRGEGTVIHDCSVINGGLNVTLGSEETATLFGVYQYEVKVKDHQGQVDMVLTGEMRVNESLDPEF